MSSHEGKFSKPLDSKPGHGEDESRLDDSRVVNVDPDEDRDLELSLEMERIEGGGGDENDEEEEKVDSDLEDLEHKGGARSPARRPLQAPKSVLPQQMKAAESKLSEKVKPVDIESKRSEPQLKEETKMDTHTVAAKPQVSITSSVNTVDTSADPEQQPAKPAEPATTTDKSGDKPVEVPVVKETAKPAETPEAGAAVAPAKEKKESTSWNPFKKKTPKPTVETAATSAGVPTEAPVDPAATPSVSAPVVTASTTAAKPDSVAIAAPATAASSAATSVPGSKDAPVTVKAVAPAAIATNTQPAQPEAVTTAPVTTDKKDATTAKPTAHTTEPTKANTAKDSKPIGAVATDKNAVQTEGKSVESSTSKQEESEPAATKKTAPTISTTAATAAAATPAPSVEQHKELPKTKSDTTTAPITTKVAHLSPEKAIDVAPSRPASEAPTKVSPRKGPSSTPSTAENKTTHDKPDSDKKTTHHTKSPPSHAEEAKKTPSAEPAGRSFKFKRNRQAAEETGNQGGQSVTVLPKHELSLKLQAAWRGKQARRRLRRQQYAAIAIQSIYRGNKERERSSAEMKRHREKIQAEQTRKTRLAHIRSKEEDLMLLASIPPDQYLDFERLRRENGAKAIQRNYRAVLQQRNDARQSAAEGNLDDWLADDVLLGTRANTSTMDARRYPAAFTSKTGKAALSGHSTRSGRGGRTNDNNRGISGASSTLLGSTAYSEEKLLREQSDKLRAHMVSAMSTGLAEQKRQELFAHFKDQQKDAKETKETPSTPFHASQYKPYEIEIEALALAQLQRKVKEAALNRTRQADARAAKSGFRSGGGGTGGGYKGASGDVNLSYDANTGIAGTGTGTGGAPRWGARRNYQDLMEAQTQANILLEEHLYALPHITERQKIRHKTLGNVQHLLQQLQAPLSLDQAKNFIQQQKRAAAGGGKGNGEHKDHKEEPFDHHAAAWLLDEALWSADNAPPTVATSNLFVNPSVVQLAAEQHVHALHALRTSGITHSNNTSTTTDTSSTKKHWGAVALPLPLHIVTNPTNTHSAINSEAPIDGTILRGSGEWKDVRNSFNRSFDADTANNTASNAATTSNTTAYTKGSANANVTATATGSAYSNTTPSSLSQRLLTDAKLFRPLATQWAAGSDVEDSLYWIAYATQPSNIKLHSVDPSPLVLPENEASKGADSGNGDKPTPNPTVAAQLTANSERTAKEYEELRRRIAVEAMCLSQRVPRVRQQVMHEQERINRLAEVYQGEMFAYLRKEHALSAAQLLGGERAQQQHRAACRVQALARGRRARIYVAGLRAQQRVYMALQNLFHEIALSEGVPPPPVPSNHNHNNNNNNNNGGNVRSSKQQMQLQAHQQGRANMFNNLLSSLAPAMHAHNNNGHNSSNNNLHNVHATANKQSNNSAPSTVSSRAGGSTLAGLNISNNSSGTNLKQRMNNTHLSALTTTPFTAERITSTTSTPAQYPLQAVIPPTNKQFTAHMGSTNAANNAYTDPRALVSNITHKHVNIHGQTPSYFSPMVQGSQHSPSRGLEAHYKDFTTHSTMGESKNTYGESKHGDYKHTEYKHSEGTVGVGIAGTPGSGNNNSNSVVNRGAWTGGAPHDPKKANAGGSNADARGGSSPSRHTFNLLTASYTAGQQVPEESLLLSQSFTGSGMNSLVGTPHSPERYTSGRGGSNSNRQTNTTNKNNVTGPFSPKATVSFSIEVPSDHNIPSGRQLQRSIDTPIISSPTRPTTSSANNKNHSTIDTPGSAASHLSEFSYVHDDDLHPHRAYISSPGGTHRSDNSLSRSLSASFGQVSGNLPDDLYEGKHDADQFEVDVRIKGDPRGQKRTNEVKSPFSPDTRGPTSRGGALSPGLLARYGTNNTALHSHSSDDSVEGLEIPYNKHSSTGGSLRSFRVHGTVQASKIAARATVAVQQAMAAVEGRFRSNSCTVQGFVGSAMAADVRNFDKAAALRLLQSMAMVTGVSPLIHWLQRFRYDPQQAKLNDPDYVPPVSGAVGVSPSTSLILTVGEIAVQDCALLIAELTAELQLIDTSSSSANKQQSDSEREKEMMYNLIQTCVLLKLLGAAADSGRLHISELHALLEDSWVLAVPMSGTQVSLLLAQLRFALLQHATRKAHHPRKSFDALLTYSKVPLITRPASAPSGDEDNAHLSTTSVATLFSCIFTNSAHFTSIGANTTVCVELAEAAVRLIAWKDSAEEVSVLELRNFLCSLCSFRSLQKRIQVWFRAVPGMHQSLLKEVAAQLNQQPHSGGMVNSAAFCQACDASGLPLSHAECFMLGQLLTRRKPNTAGVSAEGGVNQAFVDVAQLQRIKVGDFLQAAL